MTIILRTAVGVVALGAALLVTGCSPSTPAPVATQTVTVPASSSTAPTTAPTTASSSAGEVTRCVLADLTPTTTRPDGTTSQQRIDVVWTNTSRRTCTMTGFGGVDLVASPRSQDRYSLPRAETPTTTVRLAPGERAHSTIVYLPATAGQADQGGQAVTYTPTQLFVTPPDETHSAVLEWPGGPVLRQDGATHPGTHLEAVAPGAS